MEPIHGNDILLSIKIDTEYYPVLCAVDMTFNCSQEIILATSVDTGNFRKKRLRGLSDWNVSVSGLTKIDNTDGQVSFFYLLQQNVRGSEQEIQIMFTDADGNIQVIEGVVLIPDLSINGNVSSFGDVSVGFEGSGEFTIQEAVSDVASDICEELISDTWIMAEGESSISGLSPNGKSFADKEILEVDVEGTQYDFTAGAPGNREYGYNGTSISFEIAAPEFGQKIFVLWKQ
jgi:predicted secreted protein